MQQQHSLRIDQAIDNSRLYQPLRRSLLRNSLSQSHISNCGQLSSSRLNNNQDLSTSRISKRMRSLSPQQVQTIKTNIFIPVNRRLLPTNNLQLVKNKKYLAIDVQQKILKPIPAIKFNSLNRFNVNKVEQIVYQLQQQPHYVHNQHQHYHSQSKNNTMRQQQSPYQYPPQQYQTPQQQYQQYNPFSSRKQQTSFINRGQNIYTSRNYYQQQNQATYNRQKQNSQSKRSIKSPSPQINNNMHVSFGIPTSQTSFANNISRVPSPIPIKQPNQHRVTSQIPMKVSNIMNNNSINQINTNNNTTSQVNNYGNNQYKSSVRQQVQTSDYLPGSRTSFQVQKMSSQVSKGYDFSRLTGSTVNRRGQQDTSDYSMRKKQQWKYNLYSIFDQPMNTKCSKTGCFNNQIIASRPNTYQWQQ